MSKLLFISTNGMWGGSEELWIRSAADFKQRNYTVFAAAKYWHAAFDFLENSFLNYNTPVRHSFLERALYKLKIKKIKRVSVLYKFIQTWQPDLIIISQGDNIQALEVMQYCCSNNLKFITISQLVQTGNFFALTNENIEQYQSAYLKAQKNFFVSENNLRTQNLMLGIDLPNAAITPNPCKVYGQSIIEYPETQVYNIAIVGRIECFHKGCDLLIQVLDADKWRKRNVHFNMYGTGPHFSIIQCNIKRLQLTNISLNGFCDDIRTIWENNHLLCMPSRLEGQSLALIEAMYFGRAAVVTDVGGVKELISDEVNGFIAATASVKDIDEALERAWMKKEEWKKMGEISNRIIIKKYKIPAEISFNNEVELLL